MTTETEQPDFEAIARQILSNADKTSQLTFTKVWVLSYNGGNWRVLFSVDGDQYTKYLVQCIDGENHITEIDDAPMPEAPIESEE